MARVGGSRFFLLVFLVAANCDNTDAGQRAEPSGPPQLTRIMAQPVTRACTRCRVTDLLDTGPPASCAVDRPCDVEFQVLNNPPPSCQLAMGATTGVCSDPLAATSVGLGGSDEGNAFRIVFSKPLDPALNDIMKDANGNPIPVLQTGIAQIDDPKGQPLNANAFYDPTGASTTSDAIAVPFGPAIELDLIDPLAPNTTYTVVFDSTRVVDRNGRSPTDVNNVPLPAQYALVFTTEPTMRLLSVTPNVSGAADATKMTPSIAPDDVIQLLFPTVVADPAASGSTAQVTLSSNGTNIPVEVWRDQGAPGKCAGNRYQLDIVAVSANGVPKSLAAGQYTLTVDGIVDGMFGSAMPYSGSFTFFVTGMPNPKDASAVKNFYVPGAGACK